MAKIIRDHKVIVKHNKPPRMITRLKCVCGEELTDDVKREVNQETAIMRMHLKDILSYFDETTLKELSDEPISETIWKAKRYMRSLETN